MILDVNMTKLKASLILLLLVGLMNTAYAVSGYKCTAKSSYVVTNADSSIARLLDASSKKGLNKDNSVRKMAFNSFSEFVIDRNNGNVYTKSNSLPSSFVVLYRGDNETSFRALNNDGKHGISYIVIRSYVSDKKPFIYFNEPSLSIDLVVGTCVDY